jgi:hypothetical protein
MKNKQTAIILNSTYIIYSDGRLFNSKTNKFKKFTRDTNGYMKTQIWINNKATNFTQHRLLATYFIDNPYSKLQVNHINGIKHDNRLENLEWVTQSENAKHSFLNGLQKVTKPNKKVINIITGRIFQSVTLASEYYGVSRSYLSNMLGGRVTNNSNLKYYGK